MREEEIVMRREEEIREDRYEERRGEKRIYI